MQHATNSILKIVKVSKEVKLWIYSTVRHRKSSYAVKNDLKRAIISLIAQAHDITVFFIIKLLGSGIYCIFLINNVWSLYSDVVFWWQATRIFSWGRSPVRWTVPCLVCWWWYCGTCPTLNTKSTPKVGVWAALQDLHIFFFIVLCIFLRLLFLHAHSEWSTVFKKLSQIYSTYS